MLNLRIFHGLILWGSMFLLTLWFTPVNVPAQEVPQQTTNLTTAQRVQAFLVKTHNIGLVVGVWEHGRTEVSGYGKVAKDRDVAPDGNTLFEIGSITKVFTATLFADMMQRGELALDTPIQKFLPPDIKMPTYPGEATAITFRHLLTHTSGLPRLPENLFANVLAGLFAKDPYADYTSAKLYQFLSSYTLSRPVGKQYEYSNLGVGLVGFILTQQTKTDYDTLIQTRIGAPLNMSDTRVTLSSEQQTRLAQGYSQWGNPVSYWHFQDTLAGAGALYSTANDLLKFVAANLSAPPSALDAALQMTHQVQVPIQEGLQISLAWHVLTMPDGDPVIWHNGGTAGFRSFLGFSKARQCGVVLLTNSEQDGDALALEILQHLPSPVLR